jgi:DNA-binding IclR family transcriptional regulator
MRRTGLSRTAAERALRRLEAAGLADPSTDGFSWRTGADTLTPTRVDDQ